VVLHKINKKTKSPELITLQRLLKLKGDLNSPRSSKDEGNTSYAEVISHKLKGNLNNCKTRANIT